MIAIGKIMTFDPAFVWSALPAIIYAARINFLVAICAFAGSLVLGMAIAMIRHGRIPVVDQLLSLYISFIRGTPALVQIFAVYYVLPSIGISLPPLTAGILALALNSAAFIAEILRAGISSVPRGQFEASRALGLHAVQRWRLIVLPQVFRAMLPSILNEFTVVIKSTPIISLITVVELLRTAQQMINQTFRPFEMLVAAALVFFFMNFVIVRLFGVIERRTTLHTH